MKKSKFSSKWMLAVFASAALSLASFPAVHAAENGQSCNRDDDCGETSLCVSGICRDADQGKVALTEQAATTADFNFRWELRAGGGLVGSVHPAFGGGFGIGLAAAAGVTKRIAASTNSHGILLVGQWHHGYQADESGNLGPGDQARLGLQGQSPSLNYETLDMLGGGVQYRFTYGDFVMLGATLGFAKFQNKWKSQSQWYGHEATASAAWYYGPDVPDEYHSSSTTALYIAGHIAIWVATHIGVGLEITKPLAGGGTCIQFLSMVGGGR